jgi:septal ring factor EnvC (AmiA/AmiB activator)
LGLLSGGLVSAQSKEDLQKERKKLEEEIAYTSKQLEETSRNKQYSIGQLQALEQKIKIRRNLISNMEREVQLLEREIVLSEIEIDSLEKKLEILKERYAQMVRSAYNSRGDYDRLLFLFSSSDFNQAYQRLQYMKQLNAYRRLQADNIQKEKEAIEILIEELVKTKKEKEELIQEKEEELESLGVEIEQQNKTIQVLTDQEDDLKRQLREKEKAAKKLEKAIQKIIEEEMERARRAAEAKGDDGFALTPEAQLLSDNFEANKGQLPWPVEKGYVTAKYGQQPHPVLKGIVVNNDGIEISTTQGAMARAAFDGEVSGVIVIPGAGKAVLIRHGAYRTVYANLQEVYVSKGDKVNTKQNIGVVRTDSEDGKTVIQFQVWKNVTKEDPEHWIFK